MILSVHVENNLSGFLHQIRPDYIDRLLMKKTDPHRLLLVGETKRLKKKFH